MVQLDHSVIRPFQPNFDPLTSVKWLQAAETRVLENAHGAHHDRPRAAMTRACLSALPKKERKHKRWHKPRARVLNPFVRWRNACMGNWNEQHGRSALLVTETDKQDAVRACNQQTRERRALHVVQEAVAVEKAANSNNFVKTSVTSKKSKS
jgi:hypothetical protein